VPLLSPWAVALLVLLLTVGGAFGVYRRSSK